MTSQKKRGRARRLVERTMDEAFEALEAGESALADKLSRRAAEAGHVNPRMWLDRATIAVRCGDRASGVAALRQAIALAPGFVDALLALGVMLCEDGASDEARTTFARAHDAAHDDDELRAELAERIASLGPVLPQPVDASLPTPEDVELDRFDPAAIAAELLARGVCRMEHALEPDERAELARLAAPGSLAFGHELGYADDEARCVLRFARSPLAAAIVRRRESLLGALAVAEAQWSARFLGGLCLARSRGAAPGEIAAVRFEAGGFLAHWRIPRWKPEYPFAAILVLESDSTRGLDHELVDLRPGRKRRAITTGLSAGDVALVCAHRRVVRIAGVDGLQEIAHALSARSGPEGRRIVVRRDDSGGRRAPARGAAEARLCRRVSDDAATSGCGLGRDGTLALLVPLGLVA